MLPEARKLRADILQGLDKLLETVIAEVLGIVRAKEADHVARHKVVLYVQAAPRRIGKEPVDMIPCEGPLVGVERVDEVPQCVVSENLEGGVKHHRGPGGEAIEHLLQGREVLHLGVP